MNSEAKIFFVQALDFKFLPIALVFFALIPLLEAQNDPKNGGNTHPSCKKVLAVRFHVLGFQIRLRIQCC